MPICNDLVYNYPASTTDGGEMKRFLFNDFVAQAAVANAGILSKSMTIFDYILPITETHINYETHD